MKVRPLKQLLNRLNDSDDVYIIDSNGDSLCEISSASIGTFQNERFAMLAMSSRCKAVSEVKMLPDCIAISDLKCLGL